MTSQTPKRNDIASRTSYVLLFMVFMVFIPGCWSPSVLAVESDAVAFVHVEGLDTSGQPAKWTGTAVAVSADGWLISNAHLVASSNTIRLFFNSGTRDEWDAAAKVVLIHADKDLALLRVACPQPLAFLSLASDSLDLEDSVRIRGFPLGYRVTEKSRPTVTVVKGEVSAMREDADGYREWIDIAAVVAGGNSGSPVIDENGNLCGLVARHYAGFARAVPIQFVHELLGEATVAVNIEKAGESTQLSVEPQGPANAFAKVLVRPVGRDAATRLRKRGDVWQGRLTPTTLAAHTAIEIHATDEQGRTFQRIVPFDDRTSVLRATVESLLVAKEKANGFRWDGDDPDPWFKLYVNDVLVKNAPVSRNQRRYMTPVTWDCGVGDRIRIEVWDKDFRKDDFVGTLKFTAKANQQIKRRGSDQLEFCRLSVRQIPFRIPAKKDIARVKE